MRVVVVLAIVLATMALLAMPPAGAKISVGFMGGPVNIGFPYVVGPCFTFATPFAKSSFAVEAFNTSTLAHDASGALAIAFPSAGVEISPAIAQTMSESIVATTAYFYTDNVGG